MKIYLAGGLNMVDVMESCNVDTVLSSWLEKKEKFYPQYDMFLDSGAFSAWTLGKEINLDDYVSYIKLYQNDLSAYASLDVIGDAEATYKNFEIMKEAGVNPVPTFHLGEDFSYLHKYLETEGYIALGGTVGSPRSVIEPFLDNCFSIIGKNWPKKIHGFGLTSWWALEKYPFYSVDSTGWLAGGKFGRLMDFKNLKLSSDHYSDRDLVHKYGKDYYDVIDNGFSKAYKGRNSHNIKVYKKLEETITDIWKARGITWS